MGISDNGKGPTPALLTSVPRDLSVFINCPFDEVYRPLFEAMVLATLACGFFPRCALETGSTSLTRMERILPALSSSKYSIHDLSRCYGEGEEHLARFNMPLELGMAMAFRFSEASSSSQHDWFVMVPEGHGHLKFVSDLAGFDLAKHDSTVDTVVPTVMSWLASRTEASVTTTPRAVLGALKEFDKEVRHLTSQWKQRVPWAGFLRLAIRISKEVSDSSCFVLDAGA
jgi:hypothetical protein